MNCIQTQTLLDAYADSELGHIAVFRVRRHLAACPACAAELASIQQLSGRVPAWRDLPAPESLGDRIAAALPPAVPAPSPPRRLRVAHNVAAGALCVGVTAASGLILNSLTHPTIAYADVVKAMASVNTVSAIHDWTIYSPSGQVAKHYHYQTWARRSPSALATIPLSGSYIARSLRDRRGEMRLTPDGRFLAWDTKFTAESGKNTNYVAGLIDDLASPLRKMAEMGHADSSASAVQGQLSSVEGEPALKFTPKSSDLSANDQMTVWISSKTKRVLQVELSHRGTNGVLASEEFGTHYRYDETPPPGTFDIVPMPRAK